MTFIEMESNEDVELNVIDEIKKNQLSCFRRQFVDVVSAF